MNDIAAIKQSILALDINDPLGFKRQAFELPQNKVYLDGNSLGPVPKVAKQRARLVVEQQWQNDLITSWNKHQWIDLPETVGEKVAKLIGAAEQQVICCDSVSINLFKLIATALKLQQGRHKVISQNDNFPTDLYMAQGLSNLMGKQNCELLALNDSDIEANLDQSVAVLMLTQVNFRTGKVHDIQRITELAHSKGILVIWDLAHSAGAIPIELDQWQVDFAVGCGYKYFNGGPGAPAFVYVNKKHLPHLSQPLSGWMGHKQPFDFGEEYVGHPGIKQFLCGTPGVISMSVLDAALDVFNDISISQIREKSLALSDSFNQLVDTYPALAELNLITPIEHKLRGSQLAYRHKDAYAICQAMIAEGIIADFRAPDILRFGFSPLILRFSDIVKSVDTLNQIVANKIYDQAQFHQRQAVT
jgi:kynureninase